MTLGLLPWDAHLSPPGLVSPSLWLSPLFLCTLQPWQPWCINKPWLWARLAWFLKFSAPSLPWIFPWCSPCSPYSPCWIVPRYTLHCLPWRTHISTPSTTTRKCKSQHFWPGPPSRLFQKPAWLSPRCKSPTMSQGHLLSFSWLADFCQQCPHQSGLPDWCIFHSSSLLITPVTWWPGGVSTEANSSESRQNAVYMSLFTFKLGKQNSKFSPSVTSITSLNPWESCMNNS